MEGRSVTLTVEQAALVKGMLGRGDKQHAIAAFFGVNGGRIAEVAKGKTHRDVQPASRADLPTPTQMTPWGFIMAECRKAIEIAEIGLQSARTRLHEIEGRLQASAEVERRSKHKQGKRR
jgi:hypothetical protein